MNFETSNVEMLQAAGQTTGNLPPCDFCGSPNGRKRSRYCSERCTDRAYRRAHPFRSSQHNKKYRAKNLRRILANQKQWRAQNPNYNRDYYAKHRQREISRVMARKIALRNLARLIA